MKTECNDFSILYFDNFEYILPLYAQQYFDCYAYFEQDNIAVMAFT